MLLSSRYTALDEMVMYCGLQVDAIISSLDWLLFDSKHLMDAVHQCNAQMRIFLALKQPSRLRMVFNKLPYDCVAQANKITDIERSSVIKEYICFKAYLVRFIHYHRRDTHTYTHTHQRSTRD